MKDSMISHFSSLKDPRIDRQKKYSISEILFLILSSALSGITSYVDMEDFGNAHKSWFEKHFAYKHGIPSHDTLGRVMRLVCPKSFQECFSNWVQTLQDKLKDLIAIDGKSLRHSFEASCNKNPVHMVSAWSCNTGLVICQEKVSDKSNEITAIPKLLELLDISGCLVSIDAMGCQHEIANKITLKGGNYFLSLKGNQGDLHDDVTLFFNDNDFATHATFHKDVWADHGRIETRKCTVINDVQWLIDKHKQFRSIKSIIKIESLREFKNKKNFESEVRYYICSEALNAKKALNTSRSHWHIENKLHWILDMNFDEDSSRVRKDHAPQNMAIVRRIALNLINRFKENRKLKISFRRIQNKNSWNLDQIYSILQQ